MDQEIYGPWQGKRYDYSDNHKKGLEQLIDTLSELGDDCGVVGIKQSFEDEGVILDDVLTMRRITDLCNMSLYVKIGGCEAVTDINNCVSIGIDSIIAPMVETPFALRKYIDAVKNIQQTNFYFVCESRTALSNLETMLSSNSAKYLNGMIVGRSDFTKSYGIDKNEVDSDFINEQVYEALKLSKKYDLINTMGGNISIKSVDFIKRVYADGYLDKIETRNVVVKLEDHNIDNLINIISRALSFEIDWLNFKANNYNSIGSFYLNRAKVLKDRI